MEQRRSFRDESKIPHKINPPAPLLCSEIFLTFSGGFQKRSSAKKSCKYQKRANFLLANETNFWTTTGGILKNFLKPDIRPKKGKKPP